MRCYGSGVYTRFVLVVTCSQKSHKGTRMGYRSYVVNLTPEWFPEYISSVS